MPHFEFTSLTLLLAQIGAILVVSRTLAIFARRLGQPLVIAEILAGIVLGPSVLGWLWPAGMAALFPDASLTVLKLFSHIGLILFMFLVGVELNPALLKGRSHTSIAISHASIVLPFALGAGAAVSLRGAYSSPDVPIVSFVLFMGVAMSVTAFPVLARILAERGLLASRVGALAIACAAVDDVTAWCLLALVVAVVRAGAFAAGLWTIGMALAFIAIMLFAVGPAFRRFGSHVVARGRPNSATMALILLLLIASSSVTEILGIHALFGAFLLGVVVPKEGKFAGALIEKLESVGGILLLPLFFALSGLRTELSLMRGSDEWLVTGLLTLLATVGKFGGSAIAARLTGLGWREASAIGILMNTRGLMELVVLNIGRDLGVISPTVFTMLVIMAIVTTAATTPVLRCVYPPLAVEDWAGRHGLADDRGAAADELSTEVRGATHAHRGLTEN
jgi:Kef-type K+ transport system membrane component KefB